MTTMIADIKRWIDDRPEAATHMIVVCDTFDYTDYPVYFPSESIPEQATISDAVVMYSDPNKMSKVMEVYSFSEKHTIEDQLAERRAWRVD